MTDQPRKTQPVKPIDYAKPIYIVIDQSRTKTNTKIFQGAKAPADAAKHAAERAVKLKRHVAVVGPTMAVKMPPKAVQAADMDLPWLQCMSPEPKTNGGDDA